MKNARTSTYNKVELAKELEKQAGIMVVLDMAKLFTPEEIKNNLRLDASKVDEFLKSIDVKLYRKIASIVPREIK